MRVRDVRLFALPCLLLLTGCPSSGPTSGDAAAPGAATAAGEGSALAEAEGSAAPAAPVVPEEPPPPPPPTAAEIANGDGPLTGEALELFWGGAEDPPPEVLNATRPDLENRHYLYCDELNLHLVYPKVQGIGGGYAGVGSDQAYTFAGWMQADLVWLTDYDPWIRALHKIYAVLFIESETVEAFLSRWSDEEADASLALVHAAYPEDEHEMLDRVWTEARWKIARRLRRLGRILRAADIPSFVTDEEQYQFVRGLVQQRRVRPMIGNLLDENALIDMGRISRELDVPIRVYYLSNAENYWPYPDQFRTNFAAQFFDEQSVIVRTRATKRSNGDYRYNVQDARNFVEWLGHPGVDAVADIWEHEYVRNGDDIPVGFLLAPPADSPARAEPMSQDGADRPGPRIWPPPSDDGSDSTDD